MQADTNNSYTHMIFYSYMFAILTYNTAEKGDITPESFTKGDFKNLHLLWSSTSIIKSLKWKYGYFYCMLNSRL